MASILKVDTLQKPDGSTPTAADLGIDVAGSSLQTVQDIATGTFSTSSDAFVDSGLSVTITPSSASNTLLISGDLSVGGQNTYGSILITDGNDNPLLQADSAGSRKRSSFLTMSNDFYQSHSQGFSFVYAPNTTSAFTVKVKIRAHGNGTYPIYLNRTGEDADGVTGARGCSTLLVTELAN